ncbi:MAG: hypothetical protein F2563_01215 [Actinobacteria bacterium]|uniref:Unannotated protein n=1 Tax=freshwater metagenome TaxID=449393 RepID=A0A6J6E4S3_9ZZZZ|nr:hypothetical protein [Actinomycetota bacterium]
MTISIERGLRHMAWANQEVFNAVAKLPDDALQAYISNPEWTVGKIISHICSSATWYVHRLEIDDCIDIPEVHSANDVLQLAALISQLDEKLIQAASQEDRELTYTYEDTGKVVKRWFSTILTQAVHHATEHRAQLVDALDFKGYKLINLDDLDLWAYDMFEKDEPII